MIYYNQSPPWGQFNRFINDRCLEEIAEYIQRAIPEHIRSWGIKAITEEAAADVKLGAIRLDHTRTLSVSGDPLYFCSNFDCWFPVGEEDIEDADGASLDVAGKIVFFPPGTKRYEFALTGVYRHYQYSEEGQNHQGAGTQGSPEGRDDGGGGNRIKQKEPLIISGVDTPEGAVPRTGELRSAAVSMSLSPMGGCFCIMGMMANDLFHTCPVGIFPRGWMVPMLAGVIPP